MEFNVTYCILVSFMYHIQISYYYHISHSCTDISVFRGGMRPWRPPERPNIFLTRHTVKNGISNLYILLKSSLKMQEMPSQDPNFKNVTGGMPLGPLYNCVVTMASPSLKSWLRYCTLCNNSFVFNTLNGPVSVVIFLYTLLCLHDHYIFTLFRL